MTTLKRILAALIISFGLTQAALACNNCGCKDKKKTEAHDHSHGEDGHSHDEDGAKVEAAKIKTSGTFIQKKNAIQFKAADGKIYSVNKKQHEKIKALIGKKVDLVAKTKPTKKEGVSSIVNIVKVTPSKG